MATRKPTLFQQAQKEIKRIQRAARRISERGYEFKKIPYTEKKKYTRKDVEKLKQIKAKDLYKYATAYGYRGEVYREIERSRAAEKGVETRRGLNKPYEFGNIEFEKEEILKARERIEKEKQELASISQTIIDNFLKRSNFLPEPKFTDDDFQKVVNFIESMIDEYGRDNVARGIETAANLGILKEVYRSYTINIDTNLDKLLTVMGVNYDPFKFEVKDDWESESEDEDDPFMYFFK